MGFFDRFTERKGPPAAARSADTKPTDHVVAASAGGVRPQLVAARECLDAKDLPAALALYEEILTVAGDRAGRRSSTSRGRRVSVLAGGRSGYGMDRVTAGASWGARWFARAVREVASAQTASVFSPRAGEAIAHGNAGVLAVDGACTRVAAPARED